MPGYANFFLVLPHICLSAFGQHLLLPVVRLGLAGRLRAETLPPIVHPQANLTPKIGSKPRIGACPPERKPSESTFVRQNEITGTSTSFWNVVKDFFHLPLNAPIVRIHPSGFGHEFNCVETGR